MRKGRAHHTRQSEHIPHQKKPVFAPQLSAVVLRKYCAEGNAREGSAREGDARAGSESRRQGRAEDAGRLTGMMIPLTMPMML